MSAVRWAVSPVDLDAHLLAPVARILPARSRRGALRPRMTRRLLRERFQPE